MALDSYDNLKEAALRWLGGSTSGGDSTLPGAADDAIALWEDELNRRLRVPEMLRRDRATAVAEFEALPPGVLKLLHIGRVDDQGVERPLTPIPLAAWPDQTYADTGVPRFYAIVGGQIRFKPAPSPEAPCLYRVTSLGKLPALTGDNLCTAVLVSYPRLYLYGTLKHATAYVQDAPGFQSWAALFEEALAAANRAAVVRDPVWSK